MIGKDLLAYFITHYKQYYYYETSLAFSTNLEANIAIRREACVATIDRLYVTKYVSAIDREKLFKLIHSPDQENWLIVESIIENINIDDIQERNEQIQIQE